MWRINYSMQRTNYSRGFNGQLKRSFNDAIRKRKGQSITASASLSRASQAHEHRFIPIVLYEFLVSEAAQIDIRVIEVRMPHKPLDLIHRRALRSEHLDRVVVASRVGRAPYALEHIALPQLAKYSPEGLRLQLLPIERQQEPVIEPEPSVGEVAVSLMLVFSDGLTHGARNGHDAFLGAFASDQNAIADHVRFPYSAELRRPQARIEQDRQNGIVPRLYEPISGAIASLGLASSKQLLYLLLGEAGYYRFIFLLMDETSGKIGVDIPFGMRELKHFLHGRQIPVRRYGLNARFYKKEGIRFEQSNVNLFHAGHAACVLAVPFKIPQSLAVPLDGLGGSLEEAQFADVLFDAIIDFHWGNPFLSCETEKQRFPR